MNEVKLVGRLATGVALKELGEERRVADFLLALERPRGGTDVVRVNCWNELALRASRELDRGATARVDGKLRSRSWDGPDGRRRSVVEVVADAVAVVTEDAAGDIPFEEPVHA